MGFSLFKRRQDGEGSQPSKLAGVNARYNTYFPRLYAYVRSCVGGDVPAQDIVVQAFAQAFNRAANADDDKFRTALFRAARRLCRPALKDTHGEDDNDDSLNRREREIISLVFDAGLTRGQIASLFHIRETTVSSLLMTGLRKLKEQTSPAATAAYLKLA